MRRNICKKPLIRTSSLRPKTDSVYFRYGTTGKRYYPELMTVVVREHQDFDGSVFLPSNEGAEVEAVIERLAMQVKRLAERLDFNTRNL